MQNTNENSTKLQTIEAAAKLSGASQYFIRLGCRNGTIPCVRSGRKYLVNMPLFMEQLDKLSEAGSEVVK